MKHTPGPWNIDPRGGGNIRGGPFHEYTRGNSQSQVALATLDGRRSEEERDANARLIAIAPELLVFVQSIVDTVFIVPDEPRLLNWKNAYTARAAEAAILIAKIEGSQTGEESTRG